MSVGITPIAHGSAYPEGIAWASWFEALLACALIVALLPLFDLVAGDTFGREARFDERPPLATTLPARDAQSRAAGVDLAARQASLVVAKNEAMRDLLRSAGWQWSGAMLLGLLFVTLSRRLSSSALGVALALAAWAAAAYAARIPWPLTAEHSFVPPALHSLTPDGPRRYPWVARVGCGDADRGDA